MSDATAAGREPVDVLIVDDDPNALIALRTVLEPLGENLLLAKSGREALRHVLQRDFAVILLDVQMPGLDGYETALAIRQRARTLTTPIIFVTGPMDADEHIRRGYSVGAVDYILKPVDAELMRYKVRVFAELFRQGTQMRRSTTELAGLNRQLTKRNQELSFLNRDLDAFASVVAHDLRAPLRHLGEFAELLVARAGPALDAESLTYVDTIRAAMRKMGTLLDDLLHFTRLGRTEMRRVSLDLALVVAEARRELAPAEAGREVEWAVGYLPEIPGDPALLRQAFVNLLGNALKYTRNQPHTKIKVWAENRGTEDIVVAVQDNGAGFESKHAGRLFSPFVRLHAEAAFEGTGIGLAIVRRIVERHNGRVWAEGALGQGATVCVQLPRSLPYAGTDATQDQTLVGAEVR